ncbi:MAG: phytanoyl-CoA dioxygenase family protein [Gammaproteobacteria bacterium]|nr:phytanoyl-CoA dioxygenase family protein [Gammaproteobacteria bacterium]
MMISDQKIQEFHTDGVTLLKGVLTDWVEILRAGIEKNMASPGPYVRDYDSQKEGRFFGDFCNWSRIGEYEKFVFQSPAADIAGQLMKSRQVRLFHEHVLVKEPKTEIPTPWHHDQPYYCVDGRQNCSLWLALDHVSRETAVEFVSGSHRWGKWFKPERFDRSSLYENDPSERVPDIDSAKDQYKILGWEVQPGDAIAFHFLTVHGAPANRSKSVRRRAFSSRWVGDDATFAVRQGATSPPFPGCHLKHGEALRGPEFPLVRGEPCHGS